MPIAAVRSKDVAFLISISGAGVPPAETTLDQARNEMTMTGMPREMVEAIIGVLTLQYQFARTGRGWDEYAAAREKLVARLGKPPDTIPGRLPTALGTSFGGCTSIDPGRPCEAPSANARAVVRVANILADKKQGRLEPRSSRGNRIQRPFFGEGEHANGRPGRSNAEAKSSKIRDAVLREHPRRVAKWVSASERLEPSRSFRRANRTFIARWHRREPRWLRTAGSRDRPRMWAGSSSRRKYRTGETTPLRDDQAPS